jgi:hypothetical protein
LRWLGEFDFELFFALSLVLPLFMPLVGFTASPSSRRPSSAFLWLLGLLCVLHVSWIRNSNFMLFIVNILIKGEIEKPTGQYLGLIVMSHRLVVV